MALRSFKRLLTVLAAFSLIRCGSAPKPSAREAADANDLGRILPARSPSEQSILLQVAKLPTGVPRSFGDSTVVADALYSSAANGRTCRALRIGQNKGTPRQRLACTEGQAWFFVPDVLGFEAASP